MNLPYTQMGIVAALLLVLSAAGTFVYRAGQESVQVKWEMAKVEHVKVLEEVKKANRVKEEQWNESTRAQLAQYEARQAQIQLEFTDTIDALHTGELRLRQQFRACSDRVSSTATDIGQVAGTGDTGLSIDDQKDLLRTAARCDAIAEKLTATQAWIRSVTQGPANRPR